MLYLAIYAFSALAAFGFRHSPKTGKQLYPLLLLFYFIFAAFRFEVGCDWTGYLNQFHYGTAFEGQDATSHVREWLWWRYVAGIHTFDLSYPWLNLLPTAIFFFGAHLLARRQPDRFAFLVLLFPILIINLTMSGIRQAAAIGILCVAYNMFVEKRVIGFTLLVLLASTIHTSAIVFLLLVPLVNGRYSRKRLVLAAVLAIPGALLMMRSTAAEVATSRYLDTGADAAGAAFRVALLFLSGVALLALLRKPWIKSAAPDYKLVSVGSLGMLAIAALLPLSTVIADRVGYYLIPIQAVIFARIPFLPAIRFRTLSILAAYVALGVTLAVWVSFSAHFQQCYVPYRTWLFGMPQSRYGI